MGPRRRCQCCFRGKDAARPEPQCCVLGNCCHDVASDWTVHQSWRVLRGALTQAMREAFVFRNVAAQVRGPMPRRERQAVWTVDEARPSWSRRARTTTRCTPGTSRCSRSGCVVGRCSGSLGRTSPSSRVKRSSPGRSSGATTRYKDGALGYPPAAARDCCEGTREISDRGNRRRLAAGEIWGDCGLPHDPTGRPGRPPQLPPRLQDQSPEGQRGGRPESTRLGGPAAAY